jgi:hypothetical protein
MSDASKYREPWFLSDNNDGEEWGITDGVEFYPLHIASQTEIGLAIKGTIERANAAALAATPQPEPDEWCREETCRYRHWRSGSIPTHTRGTNCPAPSVPDDEREWLVESLASELAGEFQHLSWPNVDESVKKGMRQYVKDEILPLLAHRPQPEVSHDDIAAVLDWLIDLPESTRLVLARELLARFRIERRPDSE